jgi:hypothetical protein
MKKRAKNDSRLLHCLRHLRRLTSKLASNGRKFRLRRKKKGKKKKNDIRHCEKKKKNKQTRREKMACTKVQVKRGFPEPDSPNGRSHTSPLSAASRSRRSPWQSSTPPEGKRVRKHTPLEQQKLAERTRQLFGSTRAGAQEASPFTISEETLTVTDKDLERHMSRQQRKRKYRAERRTNTLPSQRRVDGILRAQEQQQQPRRILKVNHQQRIEDEENEVLNEASSSSALACSSSPSSSSSLLEADASCSNGGSLLDSYVAVDDDCDSSPRRTASDDDMAPPAKRVARPQAKLVPTSQERIFTMDEVRAICEKVLATKVEDIRQEFNQILQMRMEEQYHSIMRYVENYVRRQNESDANKMQWYCS